MCSSCYEHAELRPLCKIRNNELLVQNESIFTNFAHLTQRELFFFFFLATLEAITSSIISWVTSSSDSNCSAVASRLESGKEWLRPLRSAHPAKLSQFFVDHFVQGIPYSFSCFNQVVSSSSGMHLSLLVVTSCYCKLVS